ncbi:MAG: sulfatase [Opitutaceae bacterium]|jgi:arylsulfatase A-like enzyme|nr:sulfatase [Opitutaceae bacterium]
MTRPPNILFVFSDQQRRHALGFMGEDPVRTPHLDRFAAESAVCDHAVACNPISTPNRGIMMTGLYPTRTGVYANDHGLRPGTPTIGDHLKTAGYWTAYIGKWHIHDSTSRFVPRDRRQGFDYWHATNCNHDTFTRRYWEENETPVIDTPGWQPPHETDTALRALRDRPRDRPFALFLSWTPPHNTHGPGFIRHRDVELPRDMADEMRAVGYPLEMQYHAPEEFEAHYQNGAPPPRRANVPGDYARDALAGYFGACESLDAEFGRLLAGLDRQGLAENTLVIYTSDHGEMLGSHGRMQKSIWFEESIGVPLLVRWPGRIAPARHPLVFNSLDWAPTLLGLAGAPAPTPARFDGTDHSATLLAPAPSTDATTDATTPASQIQNPEAGNQNPEARIQNSEFRSQKPEARIPNPEARSPNPEFRNQNSEARSRKPEAQIQQPASQIRNPKSEIPNPKAQSQNPPDALLCYFAMRNTQMDGTPEGIAQGWRALRTRRHTYVVSRDRRAGTLEHRLYDLEADPYQLAPRQAAGCLDRALLARLRARLAQVGDPFENLL